MNRKIWMISGITTLSIFFIFVLLLGIALLIPTEQAQEDLESLAFEDLRLKTDGVPDLQFYDSADGEELGYRHYPASSEENVLILLHGSGYHSAYLSPMATHLANQDIAHVYTPDLRGHGAETESRGSADYIGQVEDDLKHLITHIRQDHEEASLFLGGHSSGGGTAIRFAGGEHEQELSGYVLIAPYIHHDAPTNQAEDTWSNPNIPRIIGLEISNTLGISLFNNLDVISFNMPASMRDGTETLTYDYDLQLSMHPRDDYEQDLQALPENTLLLVGSADESFQAGEYRPLFEKHSQADVIKKEEMTHFSTLTDPRAQAVIADWLENIN
ncbi:alpha/beta hydrolase [Alkalicoccus chagannorensis]|uniref:alpha/beta hydrolase n=1 Tax=Alkalicoccus chagannorensis TaxID=427072 RepID=UPI000400CE94|nr:alpha/beta fold hydrolase [Alkalicoccus chagannorensis]